MKRPRDSQRRKLYKAEWATYGTADVNPLLRDVSTPAKYQARIDEIMNSQWMLDYCPRVARRRVTLRIQPNMKHSSASWITQQISTPGTGWQMQEWIIVHELAHIVFHYMPERERGVDAPHGWRFAMIYLDMTRRFLGARWYDTLKASFKTQGVKYKKKKLVSAATREALVARMAAVRAARKVPGVSYPPGTLTPG